MVSMISGACNRAMVRGALAMALIAASELAPAGGARADEAMAARIEALAPELDAYIARGMEMFDIPGVAVGIVADDKLVYAKGFGVGRKGGEPVATDTVFQIGSTTKAFLAATLAMAVDRGKIGWDDHVVDLYPEFQLKDPWVTREFRVSDLLAQRSGLPPYANDMLGLVGYDESAMIRSLRHVEPTSSFRNSFTYTNITHLVAGRIVAKRLNAVDWPTVVAGEILRPLGMNDSSLTAEAIESAEKGTAGHVWTADGSIEAPFTPVFPYGFGGAGAINSTIEDMAKWVRLQLANGSFEGRRIVSPENLAVIRTPRVGISPNAAYAMGWVLQSTPNGQITWHNGGTFAYGAYVGLLLDKNVGIVVLTNETNVGMPDAVGEWALDRLLGNPDVDHLARKLEVAEAGSTAAAATFTRPADPRPAPPPERLTGRFANPSFGPVEVTANADGLVIRFAGSSAKFTLAPWDDQVFVATLAPEGRFAAVAANLRPFPLGFATFMPAPDGTAAGFRLSLQPAPDQLYDFTR